MSYGQLHSQARQLVAEGQRPALVFATHGISRSSLYYRWQPRGSRAPAAGVVLYVCGVPSMKKGDTVANIGEVGMEP